MSANRTQSIVRPGTNSSLSNHRYLGDRAVRAASDRLSEVQDDATKRAHFWTIVARAASASPRELLAFVWKMSGHGRSLPGRATAFARTVARNAGAVRDGARFGLDAQGP